MVLYYKTQQQQNCFIGRYYGEQRTGTHCIY